MYVPSGQAQKRRRRLSLHKALSQYQTEMADLLLTWDTPA
jgi:hypothetical protein